MKINYSTILQELEKLVLELWQNKNLSREIKLKGTYEIVTQTDIAFEKSILDLLGQVAPEIPVLSEEMNPTMESRKVFFTVDPVDGTSNFSYGVPIYGTQVSLIENGSPTLGLIYLPVLDILLTAYVDGGAYLNGEPVSVNPRTGKPPMIGISDLRIASENLDLIADLAKIITKNNNRPRMAGCTCFDMAMVACGNYQGKISVRPKLWDVAPGMIIIKEAGGIADLNSERCIAAASQEIYDEINSCYTQAKAR